ncbi:MAG: hypothetical protein HQ553_03320 [Chloroflexi bacterium]|nr:hypothetical protein [Chloroflexota bacterium]
MHEGIVAISLIVLLFTRQVCDSSKSEFAKRLARFMMPVIIPFALVFVFIVVERIRDIA